MEVLERAEEIERNGQDVIHFEIGEPDFPTPAGIRRAGIDAINRGLTKYTHSLGIRPLRSAICEFYRKNYGVSLDPDQVIVTMGTSPGLLLALSCLVDPHDEVMLPNPGYACYESFIRYLHARPVSIPANEEDGFQLDASLVATKATSRTRAIIINSPSNPTGCILSAQVLNRLVESGIPVISDEIYHGLVYGGRATSILEYTDNAFVLNGFSKYFGMTGWRLGYVISPKKYVRSIQKLQQNFFISASSFVQYAGLAALSDHHEELEGVVGSYKKRRDLIIELLCEIGFEIRSVPQGAFYAFANVKNFAKDSLKFAMEILEGAKVATAPGIDFGSNGEGFLRFSYATSPELIREGISRIQRYLSSK